jgi:hypothetical protein
MTALLTTNLGATPLLGRGKVRDLYAVDDALLLVATDRISAFDHVLATGIPGKGKILTQISLFWFDLLSDLGSQPSDHGRCQPVSRRAAALCRSVGRPLDAGQAGQHVSRGVRGARLPGRFGLEGVSGGRNRLRHSAAQRAAGRIAAAGAALYSLHQGRGRNATTRTSALPPPRRLWARPTRRS